MKKFLTSLAAVALSVFSVGQVALAQDAGEFDGESLTVGVASDYEQEVWDVVVELAAAEGIEVEIVLFTDYVQPNIALQDGSVDLNAFQHVAFLNEWNEANDGDLTPLGFTYVAPLRAYSDSLASLDDLQDGDVVAIPNDPTNGGRALIALEQAGVIEVDDAVGILPTVDDVTVNDLNLQFEELEAAQLPNVLPDVAVAFINNNFALDFGLTVDDAIFSDGDDIETLAADYKNVIATRAADVENPLYQHIVSLYQSDAVAEKLAEVSAGADLPAWTADDAYPLDLSGDATEEAAAEGEEETEEDAE
ncbi:MetQ/NlpA family ABC transporter substrate-binding protein [Fundicoccus culcitae]|uniref:MetQ/NlpA family ABC transporter substrate-binding protein n=1 Tax=Fundicoccus culcitae TaxID=2969821 RepID=A0ABY5P324_9LACT|nr:MetQ/NlpA family ABC transporter substrate-binding protein [Fundicoccus culcitae]UUX33127.1 MetQ/NlpA family ABC transporter substrate-binding protein [Fundicoccus culcitae]